MTNGLIEYNGEIYQHFANGHNGILKYNKVDILNITHGKIKKTVDLHKYKNITTD
jgi:hypothetical protein